MPTKVCLVKAMVFSVVIYGCENWTIKKSWVPTNWCFWTVVLEKTLERPLTAGDPTSPSKRRSVLGVHWKDWCWSWSSNTLATWCEELTHWKRPWCWERLKAGEGDDRRWDSWMASATWWTWVWVNSGSWWQTGMPGLLQFMRSQSRTRLSDWTELNYLPMTLRQLRGFLGITGYCCIWIPGHGELAQPLYKLMTETQQAQTDKLVWSPDTQRLFRALQTALLQAPALSLPIGSEFNLSLKEKVWPWQFWHNPKGLISSL